MAVQMEKRSKAQKKPKADETKKEIAKRYKIKRQNSSSSEGDILTNSR